MTQTILNGGTKTTQDQYTGPKFEITVDESNLNLRLHDGATPGGKELLNRDNADQIYQARNAELDGITGFEPQERGLLVRLGPADYRLRKLTVNESNLVVTSPDGYAGNPLLALAAVIGTEHTWNGQQVFNEIAEFNAGINADVAGDLTGNSFGIHTGNVVGNVLGNAQGNHTGAFFGDLDVRGKALQLDDGQISLTKLSGLLAYVLANSHPAGSIIMWSGIVSSIPAGWFLCDGTMGTPDLRGQFLVGAGDIGHATQPHDTGGVVSHTHTATSANAGNHLHTITVDGHILVESEMPSHRHLGGVTDNNDAVFNHGSAAASPTKGSSIDVASDSGTLEGYTTNAGGDGSHDHTASSDSVGLHNHGVTVDPEDHIPPYYALCIIMKG